MSNFNLYIDARSLCNNILDGKNIYARELISSLLNSHPSHVTIYLIGDQPNKQLDHCFQRFWHYNVAKLVNKDPKAIFFSPTSYLTACLLKQPSLVTVHDLIALNHPQRVSFKAALIENFCLRLLRLKKNISYLTVSEATKDNLEQFFNRSNSNIYLSSIGCDINIRSQKKQKYILCLQALHTRKNQQLLIKAFAKIHTLIDWDLYLAGYADPLYLNKLQSLVAKFKIQDRVKFLGPVSKSKKIDLYSKASLCVYPNLYEGFGMPLIESLNCHTPILTSNIPPFIEINNVKSMQFKLNIHDLSERLMYLFQNQQELKDLLQKQRNVLPKYNWQKIAQSFWKIFK